MKELTIKVDNVAKSMQGLVAQEVWYNFPKGSTKKFEGITKGDTVLLAINEDGKVEEFKITAKGEAKKPFTKSFGGGPRPVLPENARQTAVNAVMSVFKDAKDLEENFDTGKEAMKSLEKYILTGGF